jgi:hypothetical protein
MTRAVQAVLCKFGLSWGYRVAAQLLGQVLPGVVVSAKTVERVTKRTAHARQEEEDATARRCLEPSEEWGGGEQAPEAGREALPPFARPERVYLGLDGVLVRGRAAKEWLEVQVGSWWSA